MDLLNGGDLRYHICKYRRFDEETTSKSINIIQFNYILILDLSKNGRSPEVTIMVVG